MAERRRNGRQQSKQKVGLGLALWVAAALILFILFIVNQGRIIANLKETGFFSRVFGKTPAFVENASGVSDSTIEKNDVAPVGQGKADVSVQVNPAPSGAGLSSDISASSVSEPDANPAVSQSDSSVVTDNTMNIKLFFMSINSDGSVSRKEVTRAMKKSGGPLMDAINALIAGPTVEEESSGCRTLVSTGTRLLGASVKDGVATLNFSGEFEFNQYGIEGTRGQLQQIVYTATAFPTVESVQFLVDGENREYLGSEGVWIGTPLGRSSF